MSLITPYRIRVFNNHLLHKYSNKCIYKIRGKWYSFREFKRSMTPDIIYREILNGFYNPILPFKNGDAVLDLGANIGMFSIPLAKEYPNVKFFAIEANYTIYQLLCENIKKNKVNNVFPFHLAISNENGSLHSMLNKKRPGSSITISSPIGNVRAVTFASLLKELKINNVKLLKVDIEGAEHGVFTIKDLKCVQSLIGEVHILPGDTQLRRASKSLNIMNKVNVSRVCLESARFNEGWGL